MTAANLQIARGTFAIRVWQSPSLPKGVSGGPTSITRVGELEALKAQQTYDAWERFWSSSSGNVLMLLNLLAAFAGLFLFWMRPQDRGISGSGSTSCWPVSII
jgi:hypothetical protein